MRIKSFQTLRPPTGLAKEVASLPYDVGSIEDARVLADANEKSFLHVERPEVDLPETFDHGSGIDHETATKNLQKFLKEGWLIREEEPCVYLYRITMGDIVQTGIVACCHIEDYENNIIRKHEKTKRRSLLRISVRFMSRQPAHIPGRSFCWFVMTIVSIHLWPMRQPERR